MEEFENKLSKRFLENFAKKLPLNYCYLDWLLVKIRLRRQQKLSTSSLKLDYIQPNSLKIANDRKKFFTLLQFLVYAQSLDYEMGSLGSIVYRQVFFRVQDFLKYTNESNNYYQLKKLKDFFEELQENS